MGHRETPIEHREQLMSQLEAVSAWGPPSIIEDVENGRLISSLTGHQQLVAICRKICEL